MFNTIYNRSVLLQFEIIYFGRDHRGYFIKYFPNTAEGMSTAILILLILDTSPVHNGCLYNR